MPNYEVRMLQNINAPGPVEAVEDFIMSIVDNGLRAFMYRTQDLDSDPLGESIILVQNRQMMTLSEAAELFEVDLFDDGDDDEDLDDEEFTPGDRTEDPEPYTEPDDDIDSVVNVDTD